MSAAASASTIPSVDTEDATLDGIDVADGHRAAHAFASLDVRNGDFARGVYDDDAANIRRVPVHAQFGVVLEVARFGDRRVWLSARSSNGFHSPIAIERRHPRSWYETNNLLAIVVEPLRDFRAGFAYTSKSSPNGISSATQEASITMAYSGRAFAAIHPKAVVTRRTRGEGGIFTLIGVEPRIAARGDRRGATLSLPLAIGVGWQNFYDGGSGNRLYGQAGLTYDLPVQLRGVASRLKLDATALIRDDRLRRLGGSLGETGTVIPIFTATFIVAY